MHCNIRWLVRKDMESVLKIEWASFAPGVSWQEEDFLCCLRQRNCIGMVAERDGEIVGYMIYELHKSRLRILTFAVCPFHRREGVGTALANRLFDKLSQQRRTTIDLAVSDRNLPAHLFWRAVGFRCVGVSYEACDNGDDAYVFEYTIPAAEPVNA